MSRPRYAKGTFGREIIDVLRDAPSRTLTRRGIIRAVARRRRTSYEKVLNAVAQALHRLAKRGDVLIPDTAVYMLSMPPISDEDYAQAETL